LTEHVLHLLGKFNWSAEMAHSTPKTAQQPDSRVLIIATGGTICMKEDENGMGLVPATGFMEEAMKPRPSFNDGSAQGMQYFS
jgi:lysophospholipase